VNRDNRFNVSFGRYVNPTICDADNLRACARALQVADIHVADFGEVLRSARKNDFIYFDPPYVPLSATSSFTSYTSGRFTAVDQERLRDAALLLRGRGTKVLLSNSSSPVVRQLYRGFELIEVSASRFVNSKADRRGAITELLIR
jgi:DNA adenine methylase